MTPLAHGIGGVRDLPVPESFFFTDAAVVLVVSFLLLGLLWKRPLLERRGGGARSRAPSRGSCSRAPSASCSARSRSASSCCLRDRRSSATSLELLNFAPTFVYVVFWLGMPLLSVLFGNVWRVLSPWRAIADATVWVLERGGARRGRCSSRPNASGATPPPWRFRLRDAGARPPDPAYPRTLGVAAAIYTYWALAGMAIFGRDTWTRCGEGFAVAFALFARIAPFAARDGPLVLRWPFTGLAGADRTRGSLAFVAVMLGSTSFDGFSRTSVWRDLLARRPGAARRAARSGSIDLATTS